MALLQGFVELEFTGSLGPPAGRYPVAPMSPPVGDDAADVDVLAIAVRGAAPARRGLVLRRAKAASADEDPRPVPLQAVTWVRSSRPFADAADAREQLAARRADDARADELVDHALAQLNRAIRAYRHAAVDPYAVEVTRREPRAVRVGYGTAEQIADGRWTDAFEPRPQRRGPMEYEQLASPGQAVALALRGDEPLLEGEDLLGRIALDLAHGRPRAAAAQLAPCLALLAAELGPAGDRLGARVEDAARLGRLAVDDRLDGAALAALRGQLDAALDLLARHRAERARDREEVA